MKKAVAWFLTFVLTLGLLLLPGCHLSASGPEFGQSTYADTPTVTDAPPSSGEKVYKLIVQNHDPATSICGQYIEAWGKTVEDASGGRIKFIYYHDGSLVNADSAVKAVLNDTADICWSAASIYSGQFPISEFIQLPLSGITCARMGCDVMQDMYREIPAFQNEYRDFKVIMLGSCTYAPFCTTGKKLETVGDIQGLRIRAPGSTCALWCSSIGMSPMTVDTPDTKLLLEKGIIDGCLNDWHNIWASALYTDIHYIMDYPTPGSPIFMLMNRKKYESLPTDLQAVIDTYSGGYASRMAGIYWDSTRAWLYDHAMEYSLTIYEPSETLYSYLTSETVKEKVHKQYIEYLDGFGLDGQRIYGKCMEFVSRYTSKYANPWAEETHIEDFKG